MAMCQSKQKMEAFDGRRMAKRGLVRGCLGLSSSSLVDQLLSIPFKLVQQAICKPMMKGDARDALVSVLSAGFGDL